ncbi:hypothetical protein EU523_01290 [Candidatus Heimdallarchaeota archaeon]|nr:MAG: hypothetical protein EU523_01290 [Candidatus Heimdallarchaeota archaeon]
MEELFKKKGWSWKNYQKEKTKWIHPDFTISITQTYRDKAYHIIEFTLNNTPAIVDSPINKNKFPLRFSHTFLINLPREYPANLAKIKMSSKTSLWHPRIAQGRSGYACITVNGELDRILNDIIFHLLLDPRRIRPPKLYPKEDAGMNVKAMRWFEKNAEDIHQKMLDEWNKAHKAKTGTQKKNITIISNDSQKAKQKSKSKITIITTDAKGKEDNSDSKEKKDEKEDKGVRII